QAYLRLGILPHDLGLIPARFTFFYYLSLENLRPELQKAAIRQHQAQEAFIAERKRRDSTKDRDRWTCEPATFANDDEYRRLESEVNMTARDLNHEVEHLVRVEYDIRKFGGFLSSLENGR